MGRKGTMDRPWGRAMALFPLSDPVSTPEIDEAGPTLLMSWGMEQVWSHPHVLASPLPAEQPSHTFNVHPLSQDSQDQGLFHLIWKCSSALFGEQDQSRKDRAVLPAKPCA